MDPLICRFLMPWKPTLANSTEEKNIVNTGKKCESCFYPKIEKIVNLFISIVFYIN